MVVQISVTVPYLTENFDPTPLWWLRCRYLFHTLPQISPRHQQIQRHYGDSNFGVLRMPRVYRGKKSSALWRFRFRVSASSLTNIPSAYWEIQGHFGVAGRRRPPLLESAPCFGSLQRRKGHTCASPCEAREPAGAMYHRACAVFRFFASSTCSLADLVT